MSHSISARFSEFSKQLPNDMFDSVGKNAVCSFLISAIFTQDFNQASVAGALAGMVSLVHALTTPLFRRWLNYESGYELEWWHRAFRIGVNCCITQFVVNTFSSSKVSLVATAFFTFGISLVLDKFKPTIRQIESDGRVIIRGGHSEFYFVY